MPRSRCVCEWSRTSRGSRPTTECDEGQAVRMKPTGLVAECARGPSAGGSLANGDEARTVSARLVNAVWFRTLGRTRNRNATQTRADVAPALRSAGGRVGPPPPHGFRRDLNAILRVTSSPTGTGDPTSCRSQGTFEKDSMGTACRLAIKVPQAVQVPDCTGATRSNSRPLAPSPRPVCLRRPTQVNTLPSNHRAR